MTIATYVLKVASRCNMDCSYCYVYRAADSSWRRQPAAMTESVARAAAARIRAECERTGLESVNVNLHGGEPLLIGLPKLDAILEAIRDVFAGSGIRVDSALQTNGLLLDEAAIAWLADRNVGLYVSLDGPPAVNDRHRVDRRGAPTARRVEDRLAALLASGHHDRIFQGFLAVIDAGSDPVAVFDHLARYRPPAIDFLLPLTNHDGLDKQTHADWLIGCFDHWFDGDSGIIVRTFQRIIARLVLPGATSGAAGVPVEALVVETDGAWEIDDTLKTAFDGASHLGLDVHGHSVAEVTASSAFRLWERRSQPPRICRDCDVFAVCQGWHASQRYSQERGYDNPNVHCEDLQRLIAHVADRVHRQFLHLASPDSGARVGAARS